MKSVTYYYEGETEKNLLDFLKNNGKIKHGKMKKFNLWNMKIKNIVRSFPNPKSSELFFIVDTDKILEKQIFINNIKILKPYNACLIIQHKNLEDELHFSCNKSNKIKMFQDFYTCNSENKFKTDFANEKNLRQKLRDNNFDCEKLWSRNTDFKAFLKGNHISIKSTCNYKL